MYVDINGEEIVLYLKRKESWDGINTFIERTDSDQRISDLSISNNDKSILMIQKVSVLKNGSIEQASRTDQIVERG